MSHVYSDSRICLHLFNNVSPPYRAWTSWHCKISTCFQTSILKFCTNNSKGSQHCPTDKTLNSRVLGDKTRGWDTLACVFVCICTPVTVGAHTETRGQPQGSYSGRPSTFQGLISLPVPWTAKCSFCHSFKDPWSSSRWKLCFCILQHIVWQMLLLTTFLKLLNEVFLRNILKSRDTCFGITQYKLGVFLKLKDQVLC